MFINFTHLGVLLKKDFLTLWRSYGFLIAFIVLPIGLMGAFIGIQGLVDNGITSGSLIYDHFYWTSTKPLGNPLQPETLINFYGYEGFDSTTFTPKKQWSNILKGCIYQNSAKYNYTKLAVVAEDPAVAADMQTFFTDYFLANTGVSTVLPLLGRTFEIESFTDQAALFDKVATE